MLREFRSVEEGWLSTTSEIPFLGINLSSDSGPTLSHANNLRASDDRQQPERIVEHQCSAFSSFMRHRVNSRTAYSLNSFADALCAISGCRRLESVLVVQLDAAMGWLAV